MPKSYALIVTLILAAFNSRPAAADSSDTLAVKGGKLHYQVQGTGEPVVLIHGLFSSAQMNWGFNGVIAALAKEHQVIAMDLPGHGQSDKPEAEEAYGQQMVEDVVALMDHLKVKKAHIVGYSMGGMIAGKLMVTHPDRVRSCILGGMGYLPEGGQLQKFWENIPSRGRGIVPPACLHGFSKFAMTDEQLKAISLPVEIVIGDHDPVKKMYVEPLLKVRDDWPVVDVKGAGHITCIFKSEFREEIVKWVDGHKGR